jgi:uncharacterized protein (TIGR02594 family)
MPEIEPLEVAEAAQQVANTTQSQAATSQLNPTPPAKLTPSTGHPGSDIVQHMLDAGFAPAEVATWKGQLQDQMFAGGVSPGEMSDYWGDARNAPMDKAASALAANLHALGPEQKARVAQDPMEAFLAGLQTSSSGLAIRRKLPSTQLPENASTVEKIAGAAGQTVGDLPEMAIGFALGAWGGGVAGGAAGSVVPGVGTAAGAGVGAVVGAGAVGNALPELMRDVLMDQYAHPDGSKTWGDFWARASEIAAKTGKSAAVGGLANLLGGIVGSRFVSPVASTTANLGTQIGAATSVGAAIEGRVPSVDDFVTSAAVMVGLHSAGVIVGAAKRFVAAPKTEQVAENLRDIYARTGTMPQDAIRAASHDPALLGEVLAPRNVEGEIVTPGLRALAPPEPQPHTPESAISTPEPVKLQSGAQVGSQPAPASLAAKDPVADALQLEGLHGRGVVSDHEQLVSYLRAGGVDYDPASGNWCAAFANAILGRAGFQGTNSNVATSFLGWGERVEPSAVQRNDVVVIPRGAAAGEVGGHVGVATGATRQGPNGLEVQIVSGNDSDRVAQS